MKLLNSSLQLTVVASLETTRNIIKGGGVHNTVFVLRKLLAVETIILLRHIVIEQK